jgi:hypothetical protein
LILLYWKKAQKSLISWLNFWHFSCHLKVRFIYFTFKTSVEFTQKIFFRSDNSYTKTHCFYTYVTKRLGSVIKNSVQGESTIKLANVLMYLSFYPKQKWLRWFLAWKCKHILVN